MTSKGRRMLFRFVMALLLIGGLGLAFGALTSERSEAAAYTEDMRLNTAGGPVDLKVELAADAESERRGLMYRRELGANQGMLFIFRSETPQVFWMKDTYIPLDIIFLDAGRRVVHIARDAKPMDESLIPSGLPAKYVLEVPGGQTAKWGLADGDKAEGAAFEKGDKLAR